MTFDDITLNLLREEWMLLSPPLKDFSASDKLTVPLGMDSRIYHRQSRSVSLLYLGQDVLGNSLQFCGFSGYL